MPELDSFLRYHMHCNAEFYYVRKIPRTGIGRPSQQRRVVLRRRNTVVGGKCALPSALIVLLFFGYGLDAISRLLPRLISILFCFPQCPSSDFFCAPATHLHIMKFMLPQRLTKHANNANLRTIKKLFICTVCTIICSQEHLYRLSRLYAGCANKKQSSLGIIITLTNVDLFSKFFHRLIHRKIFYDIR